jgi:hypothetical protein
MRATIVRSTPASDRGYFASSAVIAMREESGARTRRTCSKALRAKNFAGDSPLWSAARLAPLSSRPRS